ncbi:MAG: hypothetical protein ABFC21_05270 [Rectinema sp.]
MKRTWFFNKYLMGAVIIGFLIIGCATPPPAEKPSSESQRAKEIVQGTSTPEMPSTTAPGDVQSAAKAVVESQPIPGETQAPPTPSPSPQASASYYTQPMTAEESRFFQNYINRLSYLVYYNENSGLDPQLAKAAVSQANRYLIEKEGLSVIDFDQIQKNKKDQISAYQAETGGSIDIITYIAQKLNADIYLEIDAKTSFGGVPGAWTGSAQGSIKIFDASTAALLGSISFLSPQTFSPVSPDAAMMNAISGIIWQSMPKVTEQAKHLMSTLTAARGVRYEIILQNTPDAMAVSQFERNLAKRVREVERLSYSPGETRFALYAFMPASKIQDTIYDVASMSGFPNCYLLYMRGRSYTFNTGI